MIKEVRKNIKRSYHGMSHTPLYNVWTGMIARVYNENHKNFDQYGGRGIKVCDEWLGSFVTFMEWSYENGYQEGQKLTLDREDVNGNYGPDNCRWVTQKEQANNKRNNDFVVINGETKTIMQWCEIFNLPPNVVYNRKNRSGWPEERWFDPIDTTSKAIMININGEERSLREWCKKKGVKLATVYARKRKGWPIERWFVPPSNQDKEVK